MSIRLRTINGARVALCAARSIEKPGDLYLDDADHSALADKFMEDFESEGYNTVSFGSAAESHVRQLREREESNNTNRRWWDSVFAGVAPNREQS